MYWCLFVFMFVVLLGAATLSYQIFKMTELDAKSRGLKHPKFWGVFSLSGGSGRGGLLLYLIGRRKYPAVMSAEEIQLMGSRKKRACVSLGFIAAGAVGLALSGAFLGF